MASQSTGCQKRKCPRVTHPEGPTEPRAHPRSRDTQTIMCLRVSVGFASLSPSPSGTGRQQAAGKAEAD